MQMVTWSADLHAVVKNLKQLDTATLQTRLNDRNFMDSLALSPTEEKALTAAFLEYQVTGSIADWT